MRISDFSGALERIKIKLLFCTKLTRSNVFRLYFTKKNDWGGLRKDI